MWHTLLKEREYQMNIDGLTKSPSKSRGWRFARRPGGITPATVSIHAHIWSAPELLSYTLRSFLPARLSARLGRRNTRQCSKGWKTGVGVCCRFGGTSRGGCRFYYRVASWVSFTIINSCVEGSSVSFCAVRVREERDESERAKFRT